MTSILCGFQADFAGGVLDAEGEGLAGGQGDGVRGQVGRHAREREAGAARLDQHGGDRQRLGALVSDRRKVGRGGGFAHGNAAEVVVAQGQLVLGDALFDRGP